MALPERRKFVQLVGAAGAAAAGLGLATAPLLGRPPDLSSSASFPLLFLEVTPETDLKQAFGSILRSRNPLSESEQAVEDGEVDRIIDGLNIAGDVKEVLRGVKQFFTPVVVENTRINAEGNIEQATLPTSYLVIDNKKVYDYLKTPVEDDSWKVTDLLSSEAVAARTNFIIETILLPLVQAQKEAGEALACEAGPYNFPTPGLWLAKLPEKTMVLGIDPNSPMADTLRSSDEQVLGWIETGSTRGVAISAVLSVENLGHDVSFDYARAIMPRPESVSDMIDLLTERLNPLNPDFFAIAYLDPYLTSGLGRYFPNEATKEERERYRVLSIEHDDPRPDSRWSLQNQAIKKAASGTWVTKWGQKAKSAVRYIPFGQINSEPDPKDLADPRRVSTGVLTAYIKKDYKNTPIPVIIIRPKTGKPDDPLELPELDRFELPDWTTMGALALAALAGLLVWRGRGKGGKTSGSPLPA